MPNSGKQRLVVGISGASGIIHGVRLLELLQDLPKESRPETHLIMSHAAEITLAHETNLKVSDVHGRADVVHANKDIGASIASGSFRTLGMIIAPCSVKTMSEVASGVTDTLLSRAADVVLKERRRLVCMIRETPLHSGHLRTMLALSDMGAIIAPPLPAFYANPKSLEEMIDHTLGRVLDLFDLDVGTVRRWREDTAATKRR